MQRFFLTCAISLGLLAALQLYAQVMNPLTRAVELPKRPPKLVAPIAEGSSVSSLAAQSAFPGEEWLKLPTILWMNGDPLASQTLMYAQTVEAVERPTLEEGKSALGDTIRMKPFAMIFKDAKRPDSPPFTVIAESARVRFENAIFDVNVPGDSSLNLSSADHGRVVSAALEGRVRITGPDGLVFELVGQAIGGTWGSVHPIVSYGLGPSR